MSKIAGGKLLARCLKAEGVKVVFGIPCPEADPLLASLDELDMRWVPVRHEAAAVHMAEGLYKSSGQLAAVIGNPGPGSANLLPGVITARHEGVPVIVITTQHRLDVVYPSPPSTFQGQDQLDVFRPAVKWGAPVLSWGRMAEVVRMATREMWNGRPGPVHIEIPMPVMYEENEETAAGPISPQRFRGTLPQPSAAQLEEAAALLAAAKRPLVFAGSGVDRAGAGEQVIELVELLGCPVTSSMAGRATVPLDHPQFIGGFGAGGELARREADVVLVAGSRFGNLDRPYDKYWGDAEQRIIQIDIDPRNLGVTRPIALGMVADVKAALEGLVQALAGRKPNRADGKDLARYQKTQQAWLEQQFASLPSWDGPAVHPGRAAQAVGSVFGTDAIYTTDGGMTSLWAHWFLPTTRSRSYHSILELGMLGTGIPSAIGAKLAAPDRQVVCVTGDGAAGFNFMEMQSAAREGLDLVTVVFAEGSWTMEEPNEQMQFGRTFGTAMGTVRWDRVAEGLGCRGEYVEALDDLVPALERAKNGGGPCVVCVRTDHMANLAVPQECMMRFAEVYQGPM